MNIERLWDQTEHDLGWRDHNMSRSRPYNGQMHTATGTRGATEVRGITFRDLRDCFIRAVLLSTGGEYFPTDDRSLKARMKALYDEADKGERAALCENDLYGFDFDRLDPLAIAQNLSCEVERIMGIYPNLPKVASVASHPAQQTPPCRCERATVPEGGTCPRCGGHPAQQEAKE